MQINWKQNLYLVWLSQFISMAAFSSAYTFIPFYFIHIGLENERLGWYVAIFSAIGNISFALASPLWGSLADIYGRRMMLLRANFAAALLIPLMGFTSNPDLVLLLRFLIGALAGTVTAAQTLILSTTPPQHRSFALGAIASALFSGMMVGQFLGGWVVDAIGFTNTFLGSGLLLASSGLLVLLGVRENFTRAGKPLDELRGLFRPRQRPGFGRLWYIMIFFICMGLAREFDGPFLPLLVREILNDDGEALRWSGFIFGFCSAAAIVSGLTLGFLADRMRLITLLAIAILVAGLLRFPQALAGSIGVLLAFRIGMVLAAAGIEPLLQSWLAGVTPEKDHGRYFGWASSFKSVGWILGSVLGGLTLKINHNVRLLFIIAGILFLLLLPMIRLVYLHLPPPRRFRRRKTGKVKP